MKIDPRELELVNLKLSLMRFASYLDEFEARIKVKSVRPKTVTADNRRETRFGLNVVLAMKRASREKSE